MRSYSIAELLAVVRRLPARMPQTNRLSSGPYATHKDHWIGWLSEYNGPGYYRRSDWKVDARAVYQRLCNGHMIVWLNEAAGEKAPRVRLAVSELMRAGPRPQSRAKAARRVLPWERAVTLLFG